MSSSAACADAAQSLDLNFWALGWFLHHPFPAGGYLEVAKQWLWLWLAATVAVAVACWLWLWGGARVSHSGWLWLWLQLALAAAVAAAVAVAVAVAAKGPRDANRAQGQKTAC